MLAFAIVTDEVAGQVRARQKLLESLVFSFFPVGKVEILIEDNNGAWCQAAVQQIKNSFRGGIQVAIDVQKTNSSGMFGKKGRNCFVEPTFDQLDVAADFRQPGDGKMPPGKTLVPRFGQALKRIKPKNCFGGKEVSPAT